jgi:hypothetical protein
LPIKNTRNHIRFPIRCGVDLELYLLLFILQN